MVRQDNLANRIMRLEAVLNELLNEVAVSGVRAANVSVRGIASSRLGAAILKAETVLGEEIDAEPKRDTRKG